MALLQLVEWRTKAADFDLALVEPTVVAASPESQLPLSAGSRELVQVASLAPGAGLRLLEVHVAEPSRRGSSERADELAERVRQHLLAGDATGAAEAVAQSRSLYIEALLFETKAHHRIRLNRQGVVELVGPANENRTEITFSLLKILRRIFGSYR